jgi:hypothetical protein
VAFLGSHSNYNANLNYTREWSGSEGPNQPIKTKASLTVCRYTLIDNTRGGHILPNARVVA